MLCKLYRKSPCNLLVSPSHPNGLEVILAWVFSYDGNLLLKKGNTKKVSQKV